MLENRSPGAETRRVLVNGVALTLNSQTNTSHKEFSVDSFAYWLIEANNVPAEACHSPRASQARCVRRRVAERGARWGRLSMGAFRCVVAPRPTPRPAVTPHTTPKYQSDVTPHRPLLQCPSHVSIFTRISHRNCSSSFLIITHTTTTTKTSRLFLVAFLSLSANKCSF